jgi:hypothetical protein
LLVFLDLEEEYSSVVSNMELYILYSALLKRDLWALVKSSALYTEWDAIWDADRDFSTPLCHDVEHQTLSPLHLWKIEEET